MADKLTPALKAQLRNDPCAFVERFCVNPETGKFYVLYPEQRARFARAFTPTTDGRLPYSEILLAMPKKSGKSCEAAFAVLFVIICLGGPYGEAILLANDLEQAQGRVFEQVKRIIKASPALRGIARIGQGKITITATSATITAVASDYAGAAGANPTITVFDELWAYTSERSRRLWDEMVPPPTRKVAVRLTTTYSGFVDESTLLEEHYDRGMKGREIGPDLRETDDGMLCYWTSGTHAPWQTDAWVNQMRAQLRPNQFARMIQNQWVRGEGDFLRDEWIEACTNPALRPSLGDPYLPIFVGVDASTKHDWCAVVATAYDDESRKVRLVRHYVWKPTPGQPLDFTNTIERALLELQERFQVQGVFFDPWQLSAVAQRLTDAGVKMQEYPQSLPNLTSMGENLLALFKDRNIEIYADGDLAQSLRNAVGIESSRGFKIGKAAAARKIDLVIALAMSALAAVRHERAGFGILTFVRERAEAAARGETPAPDTELQDEYYRIRDEIRAIEGGDSICWKCKKPLGATRTNDSAGHWYHPWCAPRWG